MLTNFLCIAVMACIISLPLIDSDAYPLNESSAKKRVMGVIGPRYNTTAMRLITLNRGELVTKAFRAADRKRSLTPGLKIRKRDDDSDADASTTSEGGLTLEIGGENGDDGDKGDGDQGEGGEGGKASKGDKGGQAGSGGNAGEQYGGTQPQLIKDKMGNWIYNLWGATYGKIGQDTRFAVGQTINRIKVNLNAAKAYYPEGGNMSTVCMESSTIYNVPIVKNWLPLKIDSKPLKTRPIWKELRMHIYKTGDSEECHNLNRFPKWRDYQECAIRRNMRLESIIPMYPMQQMGNGL